MSLKSAICFLIGHKYDEIAFYYGWPYCERCNKEFDNNGCELNDFNNFGILGCLFAKLRRKIRDRFYYYGKWEFLPRCLECRKLLIFKRYSKDYCSKYCKETSLPF